jgi:F-type H+-transporting ATPase subunit a
MTDWYTLTSASPLIIAQAHAEAPAAHAPETPATETHATTEAGHTGGEHAEGHVAPQVFFYFSAIAFVTILVIALIGMRRRRLVPNGLQNLLEMLLESLYGLPQMVMGPRGRQYAPFIATLFIYIMVMNLLGLIPIFKPATASLSITLGMSIVAFFAVQYFGFRTHGIAYLKHFLGPVPAMAILILPLELVSELIRPVSLSVRLYGNLFGEEQVITSLANLYPLVAVLMLPLQLLTIVLQAYVFSLLVTVYISLATEKHDEHEGAKAH